MKIRKIKSIVIVILIIFSGNLLAQKEMNAPKSTYELFLSDVGTMITKDFFELPKLSSSYQKLSVKIIKLSSGKGNQFFMSLSAKGQYSDKTAIIAEQDLDEIQKALSSIIEKSKNESTKELEYRESYFSTNDGFKVGYFQKKLKQTFFIELDDYQSDDTFFFNDFSVLVEVIKNAQTKINQLKA